MPETTAPIFFATFFHNIYFKHANVIRRLCSRFVPVRIGSKQFLAISEGPACCCGLAHNVLDDQQYFKVTGARSEIYTRETGVFHTGDGVFYVGQASMSAAPAAGQP
mgnify:CR=1 FL=1